MTDRAMTPPKTVTVEPVVKVIRVAVGTLAERSAAAVMIPARTAEPLRSPGHGVRMSEPETVRVEWRRS